MDEGHNFIALKATADEGSTITVEVVGGERTPRALDSDGIAILQLVDGATAIKLVATKSGKTETKTFILGIIQEDE